MLLPAVMVIAAGPAPGLTPTPTATRLPVLISCVGDCDMNGVVTVSETIQCVGHALGGGDPCLACDADGDADVAVNELVAAVKALLDGCPTIDVYEPDDSLAAARAIACDQTQLHDLARAGDEDWVRIDLPAHTGGTVVTQFAGDGFWDTTLTLYSPSGVQLAYNDDAGGTYSRLDFGCPASPSTATYFARAAMLGGGSGGRYGVRLTCQACATPTNRPSPTPTLGPDDYEPDDFRNAAGAITCGEVQHHTLPLDDADWTSFTLDARSTVRLRLLARGGYAQYALFDEAGAEIIAYDDFLCGRNALAAGRYDVRILNPANFSALDYDIGVTCEPCDRENDTPTPTFTAVPTSTPVQPDEHEPDGPSGAVPISCGEIASRSLAPLGDSDWLMLQIAERSSVRIQSFAGYPQLALQDAANRDIVVAFGSITRACGETALDAGTYFLEAFTEGYAGPFLYELWVVCEPCGIAGPPTPFVSTRTPTPTFAPRDAYEPDDDAAHARPIACGELQQHSLHWQYDEDWVAFDVAAPSAIAASATIDAPLQLYDATGSNLIASSYRFLDVTCGAGGLPVGAYRLRAPAQYQPAPAYNFSLLCQACPPTPTPTPTRPPTATRTPNPTRTPGGPADTERSFVIEPSTVLGDPTSSASGFFTTGLSGANLANGPSDGFSPGPLALQLGIPDAHGIAALHLAADVTLRAGLIDGSYYCLQLLAADSEGRIDCDGGTAFDATAFQAAGEVGVAFDVTTGLGDPAPAGSGELLLPTRLQQVRLGDADFGTPCALVTYRNPPQVLAFTTATATADKGGLRLAVRGQPFDCARFETPCSGGRLAAGLPMSQPPVGDVANVLRFSEAAVCDAARAR